MIIITRVPELCALNMFRVTSNIIIEARDSNSTNFCSDRQWSRFTKKAISPVTKFNGGSIMVVKYQWWIQNFQNGGGGRGGANFGASVHNVNLEANIN